MTIYLHNGLFPVGLSDKILKALLPSSILVTRPAYLNLLDLMTVTILGDIKFLTVEPSPFPILIPLGPKYAPQDPIFKYA